MAERSKWVRAGHKAVVTRRLGELDGLIDEVVRTGGGEPERVKLEQLEVPEG